MGIGRQSDNKKDAGAYIRRLFCALYGQIRALPIPGAVPPPRAVYSTDGCSVSSSRKNRRSRNSAGADTPAVSQKERLSIIQEEVQKFAPSKRAAAFNTINKVWEYEMDRIGEYIKEKDPVWAAWGDEFDVSILDGYKSGINMWV